MATQSNVYAMIPNVVTHELVSLGKRLKEARLRRNWTQQKVKTIAGMSVSTLKRIETGDPHVPIGMYAQLFNCYQFGFQWQRLADANSDQIGSAMEPSNKRCRASGGRSTTGFDFDV